MVKFSQVLHLYHDCFYFASNYMGVGGENNCWLHKMTVLKYLNVNFYMKMVSAQPEI